MGKLSLKERLQSVCESLIDYDWKKNGLNVVIAVGIWILVLQNFGVLPSHTEVDNQVDVEVPNRMEVTGTVDVGNTVPVNLIQGQGSQVGYHQSYVDQNGNQMWSMRNYALDGRYHLDNNDVERGQRPSVMGRKNYLFSHDDKVAEDNAIFYSLLESCDVVQLTPLDWLTDVLGRLRDNMDEDEIIQLLPYQYKKSRE